MPETFRFRSPQFWFAGSSRVEPSPESRAAEVLAGAPPPEAIDRIGRALFIQFYAERCQLSFSSASQKAIKRSMKKEKKNVDKAFAEFGGKDDSSTLKDSNGKDVPIPPASNGAQVPAWAADFGVEVPAQEVAANASYLQALFGELSGELQKNLTDFAVSFGLGSIPLVKTIRAVATMVTAGYQGYQLDKEIMDIREKIRVMKGLTIGVDGTRRLADTDETLLATFKAQGLESVINHKLKVTLFDFGVATLDAGASVIDPTPASSAILSASKLAFQLKLLYDNWMLARQVNATIKNEDTTGIQFMDTLRRCPLLYCYLLRQENAQGGYLYVEDLTEIIETSRLEIEEREVNRSDTIRTTLRGLRAAATKYIEKSPIKLTRDGGSPAAAESLPPLKRAWADNERSFYENLRSRWENKTYTRSNLADWLVIPEEGSSIRI